MGAKPFMSFLVWPLRSNWTSIMSPAAEMTVPGPNVLWLTRSPAANVVAAAAASTLRSTVADTFAFLGRGAPEPKVERERPAPAPEPSPKADADPVPTRPASGLMDVRRCVPGVERVNEPNTRPPYMSDPWPDPNVPRRSPRFSQPVPEKPEDPMPENSICSAGISFTKRERGLACVEP